MMRRLGRVLLIIMMLLAAPLVALGEGELSELKHVKSIVIEISTSPGRGNVGAAVIMARQIRRGGYQGELYVMVPYKEPWIESSFELMVKGFDRENRGTQELGFPSGRFKVIRSFGYAPLGHDARSIATHADLVLSPGYSYDGGADGKVNIASGLLGSPEHNKLVLRINEQETGYARKFSFEDAVGFNRLGHYGDDVVEKAKQTIAKSKSGKLAVWRAALALLKAESKGPLKSHLSDVSAMLKKIHESKVSFGIAYGVGLPETHRQFEAYLKSAAADSLKTRKAKVVFSVSRLKPEELARIAAVAQAQPIDLYRGDPMPESFEAGKTYLVHTDALPREAYGRLLVLADLPAIVAGDSAGSAALAAGKPFMMTRVDLNLAMIWQVRAAFEALGAEKIAEAYLRMSKGEVFSWGELVSAQAEEVFSAMSRYHRVNLGVLYAELADKILSNPEKAYVEISQWNKARSLDACERWLTTP